VNSCIDESTYVINLHSLPVLSIETIPHSVNLWQGVPATNRDSTGIRPINSIETVWQVNMDYLHGDVPDLKGEEKITENALTASPESLVDARIDARLTNIVGARTLVSDQVKLYNSIVGQGCYIDSSAQLKMSVVMDDTYVGSHTDIGFAVVDGAFIHRVILSRVGKSNKQITPLIERFFALILALVSLPYRITHKTLTEYILIPQNLDHSGEIHYQKLKIEVLHSNNPLVRKIPWLWSVVQGKLRLVGINRDFTELPLWAKQQADLAPGLINLADLNRVEYGQNDKESILIANNYQMVMQGKIDSFKLCMRWVKALFTTDLRRINHELNC
jgi:hypothetical protein